MLILILSITTVVIIFLINYNNTLQTDALLDQQRLQEKITLNKILDDNEEINSILITNNGNVEVKIRGVYITTQTGETIFSDPSQSVNTNILPGRSLQIQISDITPLTLDSETTIIATTERGTKTIFNPIPPPTPTPTPPAPPDEVQYGLLKLKFTSFEYLDVKDPKATWADGWQVTEKITVNWRVQITNVDEERPIKLTTDSSLSLKADDSSNIKAWFLDKDYILEYEVPKTVEFIGDTKMFDKGTTCEVFLTLTGSIIDTPELHYAQTIPFEAVTAVKK